MADVHHPGTTPDYTGTPDISDTNAAWWARSQDVLVGGVNSPVRSFRSVGGGTPYIVASAEGAHVTDVEGTTYIDYVQSYGASILGHAHPQITKAVAEAAARGTTYSAPTRGEALMGEEVCRRVPGIEMVRMTSSGTEASMSVIRLARAATGRDKIVKISGCYHGAVDALLAEAGSGLANQGLPGSAGIPASAVADTVVIPWGSVPDEILAVGDVAVVCLEAVPANMGLVPPPDGYLEELRRVTREHGTLLLFDEVITGFRVAVGGATQRTGVTPDLWCFGKVIGGGLPVGCFGASRELMANVAPLGPVYQGGTLSGNPVAIAAGLAALDELDEAAYRRLDATASRLADGLRSVIADAGLPVQVPVYGPLVGLFLGAEEPVVDYTGAKKAAASGLYGPLFKEALARGVALAPGPYEVLFPSLSHNDEIIDRSIDVIGEAAKAVAAAR